MLQLRTGSLQHILCIGAHADDIEIGCGGTLLMLLAENPRVHVTWVTLSADGIRTKEAAAGAERFLAGTDKKTIVLKQFPDSYFPYEAGPIKKYFHSLQSEISPDIIFTHRRDDMHQDHRFICELTWNVFRDHLILEYEIPKYEGDLGQPNLFVPLDKPVCQQKVTAIMQSYASQREKPWFTDDTFWALLRIRGVECRSQSRFAEAFHCRKLTLGSSMTSSRPASLTKQRG